ncbi:MAG: hypothetical protein IJE46_02220 [Clostridia bacterium]|nr:hypothetical protein [Clostridia bacterium]
MINSKTRQIVISGLLVAIAFIIPLMLPNLSGLPEFSATPFAHVPVMIAMFINPTVTVFVVIGTAISFFIKYVPIVGLRALTHLLFALVAAAMLKKSKTKLNIFITYLVTLVLHAGAEAIIIAVWFAFFAGTGLTSPLYLGIGIFALHHTFDFIVTLVIYFALVKAKVLKS